MGQYHIVVNLDKMQKCIPHELGAGLKLWEQLAGRPGTASALIVLLASASNGQGGGDLDEDPIVGAWRGDRIAFVGDYDDASSYDTPNGPMTGAAIYDAAWTDVSPVVARVIERELAGKFVGEGWRDFIEDQRP